MTKSARTVGAISRRSFLQTTAAASTAIALPYFIPARAFGANERITTGHIGLGGQGNARLGSTISNAIAVCDVDSGRAAKSAKRVEDSRKDGSKVEIFSDYRKMLERKDIDAIIIATPDHWHALNTIHSCQAGKDVFCEKPLTLTIAQGRAMVDAARKNNRVVQTGSQQRSDGNFRRACELVRNGKLGPIETVLVGIFGPNSPGAPVPDSDPPAELNYDMWLGPAPQRPYNSKRVHYNFRFFRDYSGGQLTNWGAHHIDIAQWGLGMDDSGPVEVEGEATYHKDKWFDCTETCRITFTYANGVKMIVGQKQADIPKGTTFIGPKGKIFVDRGTLACNPPEIAKEKIGPDEIHLYDSKDHMGDFLNCMRTREKPICDVEIGHRTATCCHLANIAGELKRKLKWDPAAEKFVGDDEANGLLDRPYRSPYTL